MWKLGRFFGIDVSLHWTLLLFIAWTAFAPAGGIMGAITLSAIFACVLLHELGHSLAARQFGIHTSSITLLPIGGIAALERMPRKPAQELWIAVAGPLVNVVIAGLLFLSLGFVQLIAPSLAGWVQYLMFANLVLVAFNLLPAFPMDGGRVLRSLLAMVMPYLQATRIAAGLGKVVALGLACLGLLSGHLMLMLAAGFVFFAGSAEARNVAATEPPFGPQFDNAFGSEWREHHAGHDWREQFARKLGDARTFTVDRAGKTMLVIWDESERRYRYATSS